MNKKALTKLIYPKLPVSLAEPLPIKPSGKIYVTIALKRSGQHAVINWLCHQLGSVVHFNHCIFVRRGIFMTATPISGRFVTYQNQEKVDSGWTASNNDKKPLSSFFAKLDKIGLYDNLLFSFEDRALTDPLLKKLLTKYNPKIILMLRDPYNCLASSFKHHNGKTTLTELQEKKAKLVTYLEQVLGIKDYLKSPVASIEFGSWLKNENYRKAIMENLGLPFSKAVETAIEEVQPFGGGSSFDGQNAEHTVLRQKVFERWKSYQDNAEYKNLLSDDYLEILTSQFFEIEKPF